MIQLRTETGSLVSVFDDVRQLTAARYQRFSAKHLELSVGSDVFAVDGNVRRLALFLGKGDLTASQEQFNHLVLGLNNIQDGVNGQAVVLATLVGSIDGHVCTDLSDTGLLDTARRLLEAGITQHRLNRTLDRVKKRLSATS